MTSPNGIRHDISHQVESSEWEENAGVLGCNKMLLCHRVTLFCFGLFVCLFVFVVVVFSFLFVGAHFICIRGQTEAIQRKIMGNLRPKSLGVSK